MTETAFLSPDERAAHQAFEAWRDAKLKSDRTMVFADCRTTAKAWARFQDLFARCDQAQPPRRSGVIPFPRQFTDIGGAA